MKTSFLIAVIILQSLYAAFSIHLDTKSIDLVEREDCKDNRDDCHWIADNHYDVPKYCWAHRNDAFIKDCPRYCGFCRQPAPARVCEDTRDDCSWIGKHYDDVAAYCDRHRNDAFIKQCYRTCGYCKVPAPPVVITCEDTRDDCSWIAEHNKDVAAYCDRHRNDAFIKQCQRTCGFCKVPAPPVVITCEDTRDDCSWIAENNKDVADYCDRHQNDAFIKQCQRTCGFCKVPSPALLCRDLRNDCSWIGKHYYNVAAYCHIYRNYAFIQQCQRTCGYCKPPAPARVCEDTRSDCDTINHIGEPKASYCARNRNDAAVKECAKTCGFC